jgi:hypothetical protein
MSSALERIVVTQQKIDRDTLRRLVHEGFGDMVKLVADIERRVAAVGGELHADGEALLLEQGSAPSDLWGANYYPGRGRDGCVEFTALINVRPTLGNPSMEISDPGIRERVRAVAYQILGEGEPI